MARLRNIIGVLSLLGAILAGYAFWMSGTFQQPTPQDVDRVVAAFAERAPVSVVDLSSLKLSGRFSTLVDPESLLPHPGQYPPAELQAVFAFATTCDATALAAVHTASLQKTVLWHRYLCGIDEALPPGFFDIEPLFHPSGSSFVYAAYASGRPEFRDHAWLEANKANLHLKERATLGDEFNALATVPLSAFSAMAKEAPLVLADADVLILRRSAKRETVQRQYLVYRRSDWEAHLRSTNYVVTQGAQWTANDAKAAHYRRVAAVSASASLLGLLTVGIWSASAWAMQKRRYFLERQRVYQSLAHELRTPITNLKLLVEALRPTYDQLPPDAQRGFLTLSGEVQRLDRLARASVAYLNKAIDLGDIVRSVTEPYGDRVKIEGDAATVAADPYWLSVCIKNLVDNALEHGAPPVVVKLTTSDDAVSCSVTDGGRLPCERLKDIRKSPQSKGLGIGLSLTAATIRRMGGKLQFRAEPSTFTLRLRRTT